MERFLRNMGLYAGILASAILLLGTVGFGVPFGINFFVAVVVFVGLYLLGSFWLEIAISRESHGMTIEALRRTIRQGRDRVDEIRKLASGMKARELRGQLERICALASQIFDNFNEDPADIAKASRFLLYLNRFLPLIERYARVSATQEGRELLQHSQDDREFGELLNTVEQSFRQGFQNYLQNDVVEMRTLGRVLKKMMTVAEIGK